MFDTLVVNRKNHVSLSKNFEEKHQHFKPSSQHPVSQKINRFTILDVDLIPCPQNVMSGIDFYEWMKTSDLVPLDIFHARSIYQDQFAKVKLTGLSIDRSWKKGFTLETINFLGSLVSNDNGEHIVCFEFKPLFANGSGVSFMCYSAQDEGWSQFRDLAAVFKKSSLDKLLKNGKK